MRRPAGWMIAFLSALGGCASTPVQPPTYARLLSAESPLPPATNKLTPPPASCQQRIRDHAETYALPSPLEPALQQRLDTILDRLHPTAHRILNRTHGIWPVRDLRGAAAAFVPCDMNLAEGTGGFVFVDIDAFPLDRDLRDAAVPSLYWRSLAGGEARARVQRLPDSSWPMTTDPAVRYLVLHELGHALSLYAGEFELDDRVRIRVTRMDGFAGYSWRFVTTEARLLPLSPDDQLVRSVIPRVALDTVQWGSVLSVIDGPASLISPGYQLTERQDPMTRTLYVCAAAANLPLAGFVTPTAARYPTEDYAEMFAHAILSDEGKIHPTDTVPVDLPLCEIKRLPSPYFSSSLRAKRRYMERALGVVPRLDMVE